jgi:hypothetical protein
MRKTAAPMSPRPMRPPTTIPPTTPALTDFEPELAAAWTGIVGMVEADDEEEEEELEEAMLDVLVPLR